jgi:hypothetical protein
MLCILLLCVHRVRRLLNEWDETVWRLSTGFNTLSLNCRNLKKRKITNASALKIKMVRQILYIHFYDSFLLRRYFKCFRILYRRFATCFPYGKLLFIHSKITGKSLTPRSALLPCRQLLVSHVLPRGNHFSFEIESSRFKGSCLTSTGSPLAPYLVELPSFETFCAKSNILSKLL